MIKKVIYGPPGTGKTTYLMDLLEQEMQQVNPLDIAFVSFTRKGTYEGADRAKKKFKLKTESLRYFKTLHSICFSELQANRMDMISKQHYRLLSTTTGINFTGYYTEDFSSTNDAYLHVLSMERHNPLLAFRLMQQLNESRLKYIRFQYGEMKKQLGIRDFDDLLSEYLEFGEPLNVKVAFIDEAQDLTLLQWKVAIKMFSKVERLYVAGDDDQAVYEWSGADVSSFLKFSDNSLILNHSYRMPEEILKLSKRITRDIRNRQTKVFTSNGNNGSVNFESKLSNVGLQGGELVLARTNWLLRQLSFSAINDGLYFKFKGKTSVDKDVIRAIQAYNAYVDNADGKIIKYAYHFDNMSRDRTWQQAIKLPPHEVSYYEKVLSNGSLERKPVLFETFHSCKGSENEHVVLSCDLTQRVQESFYNNRDAELRCLYVGMTRAKNTITFLSPTGQEHYPEKYFS